jgi:hypothetical protein
MQYAGYMDLEFHSGREREREREREERERLPSSTK